MEDLPISASITTINLSSLFGDGFELSDSNLITDVNIPGNFDPNSNEVEFFIYDYNLNLLSTDYDFTNWKIVDGDNALELYPIEDVYKKGFDNGTLYAIYNFVNLELNSSISQPYYLSDISEDRTEIRIKSNTLNNEDIESSFLSLKTKLESSEYFDEFYISFGNNEYHIATNILLDTSTNPYSILIKLYDSLPSQYNVKDTLYITTKVAESQGYQITFAEDTIFSDDLNYIKGPNFNISIQDSINNSTEFVNKSSLLQTPSLNSEFHLANRLNKKGVKLTPYGEVLASQPDTFFNDFNNFIHFSSAKERILNFVGKLKQIEDYNNDKATLSLLSPQTSEVTNNIEILNNNIKNIIENFDRYEHYLYYASSSFSYPKSNSEFPYTLESTTSYNTLWWLGSDNEESEYYGGMLHSASLYDNKNQNWLFYTIPEFIRENEDNSQYTQFCNMMGQHFDELWLYIKYITKKLNTTNELYDGVPLELAKEAIESLGYQVQGNNYNNQFPYIGLTGEDNGSFVPSLGNEIIPILNYIAVNIGYNLGYWEETYGCDYYVERFIKSGFPYSIDDVSKEIYKRLYHNMSSLLKKKGTISGLRQLINVWGVPSTVLKLSEFGGKNRDNSNDWDLWYKRYNYAFNLTPEGNSTPSASVIIPWMPLNHNKVYENQYIVPDTIQFRFKTEGIPTENFYTQSLLVKKSDSNPSSTNFDFGIKLEYTPFITSNHLGSVTDGRDNWGRMKLYISSSTAEVGSEFVESDPIYLPFFNGDWWSVMLTRDQHTSASISDIITRYTLYAKNKLYRQNEANQIGFQGVTSILSVDNNLSNAPSINQSWNRFNTSSYDGVYLGGYVLGSTVGGNTLNPINRLFSGSFQEFRYYSRPLNSNIFDDYVMNPESIEGITSTDPSSSFNILSFRADLGNELDYNISSLYKGNKSVKSIPPQKYKWTYRGTAAIDEILNSNLSGHFRTVGNLDQDPYIYFNVISSEGEDTTCFHEIARDYIRAEATSSGFPAYGHIYFNLEVTENEKPYNTYTFGVKRISCKEIGSGACISSSPAGDWNDNYLWDTILTSSGSNSDPLISFGGENFLSGSNYTFEYSIQSPASLEFESTLSFPFSQSYNSIHPSVDPYSSELIIDSFVNPSTDTTSNNYDLLFYSNGNYFRSNTEDYFVDQPIVGIKNRISNKIQIEENYNYEKVLSNQISIQQYQEYNRSYVEDINNLEAAFSFQNEINDDISQTLGFGPISDILGDPRQISSLEEKHYSNLKKLAEYYFKKYKKGNIYDYLRLIKFFDNSLFKSIKNYVPARTGITTGILIKQHLLERNRHIIYAPVIENITIEGGISIVNGVLQVSGGAGGVVNKYNKI